MATEGLKGAWKNTNLYYFSAEIEKMCDVAAKMGAKQWKDVGTTTGLLMWRIEEMRPYKWTEHGKLYRGDCYIFLNTFEDPHDSTKLSYDLHFWAGEESTEDEYGAAMFKTFELDQKLRNECGMTGSMNREVQDFESALFLTYFEDGITYMSGGIEGVILKKEDDEEGEDDKGTDYNTRLFHVKGRLGKVLLSQVKTARASMNGGDVFVLDAQEAVYVWKGEKSNDEEKARGLVYAKSLSLESDPQREVVEMDQGVDDGEAVAVDFWSHYPSLVDSKMLGIAMKDTIKSAEEAGDDDEMANVIPTLYRLKESLGGFSTGPFEMVSGGAASDVTSRFEKLMGKAKPATKPPISDLRDDGIYLVDSGFSIGVWLGSNCSKDLTRKVFPFAMLFLRRFEKPPVLSINVYRQGYERAEFLDYFGPAEEPGRVQRIWSRITSSKIWELVLGWADPFIIDQEDMPPPKPKKEPRSPKSSKKTPLLPVDVTSSKVGDGQLSRI